MIEIFLVFLSLSVSGSLLALLLLAIKPLVRKRLSQTWQYYIWLLVAIRFVLPFSPEISLIGELSHYLQPISSYSGKTDTNMVLPATAEISAAQPADIMKPSNRSHLKVVRDNSAKVSEEPFYIKNHLNFLWIPWFIIALLSLLYKIIGYHSYISRVKLKAKFPVDHKLLCLYQEELAYMGIKKALPLLINEQIASPMLIGFFQPAVILPNSNIEENALCHTFRHELIHYKRLDTLYKWFIQIIVCLHWYNPIVYFIRKEINRCCELSCDESVIKNMDVDNRILYGDTLIYSLNVPVKRKKNISLTLGENASLIKERLDMIMNFQKKSRSAACAALLLTLLLLCNFTFLGAYAGNVKNSSAATDRKSSSQTTDSLQFDHMNADSNNNASTKSSATYNNVSKTAKDTSPDLAEYQKFGVTIKGDTFYYKKKRVRIFMDTKFDHSFQYFFFDKDGSIDLHLHRNNKGKIINAEPISKDEARKIINDLDDSNETMVNTKPRTINKEKTNDFDNSNETSADQDFTASHNDKSVKSKKSHEDIKRLTMQELPADIRSQLAACDQKTWYVMNGKDRRYLYYNGLTYDYAYQYDPDKNSIHIIPAGKSSKHYVLLSVSLSPLSSYLKITYQKHIVTYTELSAS